ncbi:hypothetical protein BDF20DRAFT_902126 [Mycotypha africana]|uniref:uncharacterized protein n=1 Tax=Mycotypha africana TaxID=64632 RepID=UPI0023013F00|nr:uncharacterized protein BDF20DRAFT_902126 [Mycotypha africana]KAI8967172.1 hypothetical protein BDF20DRAFT_902126 [Mycotypha africana]
MLLKKVDCKSPHIFNDLFVRSLMSNHCGNPLLRDWMKEMMDKAEGLQSRKYYTLKKAYDSLCKCPVTFDHPSQAIQLDGIGEGLVKSLEERMRKYCKDNNLPMPQRPNNPTGKGNKRKHTEDTDSPGSSSSSSRARATKPYIPRYRTGAYAILLALRDFLDVGQDEATREQICQLAQDHCDASLTLAEPGKSYSAWNGIKTLHEKGYVYKSGRPAKFRLTETGVSLADKLKEINMRNNGSDQNTSSAAALPFKSTTTLNSSSADQLANLPTTSGAAFAAAISSDEEEYSSDNVDMSIYVMDPSKYTLQDSNVSSSQNSSTARSRASRANSDTIDGDSLMPSTVPQSSRTTTSSRADIMAALAVQPKEPSKRGTRGDDGNEKSKRQKISATSAALDKILAEIDKEDPNKVDMGLYILNPERHTSASVSNKTSSASSLTSSTYGTAATAAMTSKAVLNTDRASPSASFTSRNDRYTTPAVSSILRANEQKRSSPSMNKKTSITLSPLSTSDTENNTRANHVQKEEIVDLLSSPETSPLSDLAAGDENFSFVFNSQEDYFPLTQSRNEQIKNETFQYTYLDTNQKPVKHVAQAAVEIDTEKASLAYLVQFYTHQANHPKAKLLINQTTKGEFTMAYLPEEHIDSICPGLPATPVLSLHREVEEEKDACPASLFSNAQQHPSNSQTNSQTYHSSQYLERAFSSQAILSSSSQPSNSQDPHNGTDLQSLIEEKGQPVFCLKSGEYEIVLVVDNREIQMKGNREYFQENLTRKGIQCITRAMDLGDVVWIARRKEKSNNSSSSQTQLQQAEELVLDYIVERKRLDDLVSSIKDGRFTEQKTRLKRSGVEKVIYIVEEYNVQEAERFGMQAVQTAMSSTQMIDGFYLKRTNSIDETIDFLASITRMIERLYDRVTLYCIPEHIITRQNFLQLKGIYRNTFTEQGKTTYLVNFSTFGQLNSKNGSTSLHEIYLRMLMTIRGVNAEKALSLMKVYPTPNSLLRAFQNKTPEEGKTLAKDATLNNISRRRWGPQISERLYQVWGSETYDQFTVASQSDEKD